MTNALTEALTWSVTAVELCLFTVTNATNSLQPLGGGTPPSEVRQYDLDAPDGVLDGLRVREFDLVYPAIPDDLDTVVESWLSGAVDAGAVVAWFGFEGSFHFDHLLTRDIARQIYGVADSDGVSVALDDARRQSADWAGLLTSLRAHIC